MQPFVGLFAIEVIGHKFDNMGNVSGTTDEDELVHATLVNLRVAKNFLDRLQGTAE
jgi:hypothetical protein